MGKLRGSTLVAQADVANVASVANAILVANVAPVADPAHAAEVAAMPLALDPLTLPLTGLQVIEASAGTGKTWTLAALYVRLVLGHGRQDAQGGLAVGLYPPQILVMTFTEAATAELRGRIRERLAEAAALFRDPATASPLGDAFLQKLRREFEPGEWLACAHRLDLAAQWMDDAAIFTIHGWSSRMLRQHAFDSASLFEQKIVEDGAALKLTAVHDYWRKWFYRLPMAQLAALDQVAATPADLLEKVERLWRAADKRPGAPVFNGAAPDATPDVTPDAIFARWQAWQNDKEAMEASVRLVWSADLVAQVSTAAGNKTLKNYRSNWLPGWLRQMEEWCGGKSIALATIERFSASMLVDKGWAAAGEYPAFIQIDALCACLRDEPDTVQDLEAHAAAEIGEAYRKAKEILAQFDFSDLLQCLYRALQAPDGRLADAIRTQYPIALVDEFQDTDPWQYGALSRIYADANSNADADADADANAAAPGTALLMIGDPKQAIYSFRGADLDTYLLAREQAQAIHTLSGNFRSSKQLVAAVNHVFSSADKPFGDIVFENVSACNDKMLPLQVGEATQAAMTVWRLANDKPLSKAAFERQMAELFATQMVALLNLGVAQPGDMAVLVRNGQEARAIRRALAMRGVRSVYLSERDSVFDTMEASDLWRILRAVANPRSTPLLRAALVTRLWDKSWADLESLFQDETAWDALVNCFHAWQKIWQRQGFLPMLHQLLHDQAIPARLLARANNGERSLTNLLHLGDLLQTASLGLQGEGSLIRHLENQLRDPASSGDAAQLRLESDANLLQVITMHKAKGLQYPLVFLPFVSGFRAEKKDSGRDDAQRLAEDVRLLYVAFTRAQRALWLGVAQMAADPGKDGVVKGALSQLLKRSSADDLDACLAQWAVCPDIVIAAAPQPESLRYRPVALALALAPVWQGAAVPLRLLRSNWWIASFSAILRGASIDQVQGVMPLASERDARMEDAQIDSTASGVDMLGMTDRANLTGTSVVAGTNPVNAIEWRQEGEQEGEQEGGQEGAQRRVREGVRDGGPEPELESGRSPPIYNDFPAGSTYGTLLHDLLEWQAFRGWPLGRGSATAGHDADWQAILVRKAGQLGVADTALLHAWLTQIVITPLPLPNAAPLVLAHLTRDCIWAEMAFSLLVHELEVPRLDALIQKHVLPGQERQPLPYRLLAGMLTGFMDLVLQHDGRYYILDYKSNRLDAYAPEQLQQSILAHRYDVQYVLYLLALHRLLKSRLPDYDYDVHVGGAIYVYLRGVDQPGAGIHVDRPPRVFIEALDAAFSDKKSQRRLA